MDPHADRINSGQTGTPNPGNEAGQRAAPTEPSIAPTTPSAATPSASATTPSANTPSAPATPSVPKPRAPKPSTPPPGAPDIVPPRPATPDKAKIKAAEKTKKPVDPILAARRRKWLFGALAIALVLAGSGLVVATYYVDSVPTPSQLDLPQSTTVYYADGKTPMAKLGVENRTILTYAEMNDAVRQAIVAAEDRTFWSNEGVDLRSVLRAAWNNLTGGERQGASTITQQYARVAADLKGVTYSRKLREAVIAWKLDNKYSKEQILEFYLNTVPFGRGAYGIEAAAQAYFGKTANRNAAKEQQVTIAEAAVLSAMVKQPEADPADPEGRPGYDPKRGPKALENSKGRFTYVKEGLVAAGHLTQAEADKLAYPDTVRDFDPSARQSGLDKPTGLVVQHALSELRQVDPFKGKPADYIQNGGFRIVTTVDKRAQDIAEATADIKRPTAPESVRGQPANWQAALVAVEPGTGRVLAYYGGNNGAGADYAGWYFDEQGKPVGFGQHPPGSSFKVYDLAEAIRQKISPKSRFDSPASKEFPASGRTKNSTSGPIRNAGSARCQPNCTIAEATTASLNTTFFGLTEHLGPANVVEMAAKAGVESMWSDRTGQPNAVRIDLRGKRGDEVMKYFSTELGIGQYGITVADHANGMATFASGKRAQAHFVRSVHRGDDQVYGEKVEQADIGLNEEQVNQLAWTLSQVEAGKLTNGWDSAGKTGTWQHGTSLDVNAHTWMVGYTRALAAAVWLGTTDGAPLKTTRGSTEVFGASYPAPIWRKFMTDATAALKLDASKRKFGVAKFPAESASPVPTPSAGPVSAQPSTRPSCEGDECPRPTPTQTTAAPPTPPPPPTTPPLPTQSAVPGVAPSTPGRNE